MTNSFDSVETSELKVDSVVSDGLNVKNNLSVNLNSLEEFRNYIMLDVGGTFEDVQKFCSEFEDDVKLKENEDLYLVNSASNKFLNGVIFEKGTNNVVCACQEKFIVNEEKTFEKIKTSKNFHVEYCEDGTLVRLFNYKNEWRVATNNCIDAKESYWSNKSFDEMFWEIFDKKHLENLDERSTYFFILLHTENRIVVKHLKNKLVYIMSINNDTFDEKYTNLFKDDLNIKRPHCFYNFKRSDLEFYEELFYNHKKRGMLVKFLENGKWETHLLDFKSYSSIKEIRGNVPQIRLRYLQLLKTPEKIGLLRKHYSESSLLFTVVKNSFYALVSKIHTLYLTSHVKHEIRVEEEDKYWRTLHQLHGQYKKTNKPITFYDVKNKLLELDVNVLDKLLE